MLKILDANLDVASRLMGATSGCRNSVHCLWGKPVDQEECRFEGPCPLLKFRQELEAQAPAFMGFYVKMANFNSIMHDYLMMELEGDDLQKEEARESFRDMFRFRYVSLLGLFALYSANDGQVPYISQELIQKTNREFSPTTVKEMRAANPWITGRLDPLFFDTELQRQYKHLNYLLLMVFLRACEQEGAVMPLAPEEESAFFGAVESFIGIRRE